MDVDSAIALLNDPNVARWLHIAGEIEKIQVSILNRGSISVRCGDVEQAGELWANRSLVLPSIEFSLLVGRGIYRNLRKGMGRFIDDVFQSAGKYLEPEYWIVPGINDAEPIVIFVCRPPYTTYAEKAYKCLRELTLSAEKPIAFQIWTQGTEREQDETGRLLLTERVKQYRCQPVLPLDIEPELKRWLALADEPERIDVQQIGNRLIVRCGDCLQAWQLWDDVDLLKEAGIKRAEIFVGSSLFSSINF